MDVSRFSCATQEETVTNLELEEVGPRPLEVPSVALEALNGKCDVEPALLSELADKNLLLLVGLR